ncbi:MAG: hypothetical protein HUU46_18865 [Candidatus Hydrogenedentes bacterium]|nr:hypothetical protein [Candidatus Hydrogenedentota bacterium]
MKTCRNLAPLVPILILAIFLVVAAGCPAIDDSGCDCINLAAVIVGTWELHQGGTITFYANGDFETSEGTEGEYRIVNQSVLLDIASIEGELNQVLTYLGELPNGSLLFSQETPMGFERV